MNRKSIWPVVLVVFWMIFLIVTPLTGIVVSVCEHSFSSILDSLKTDPAVHSFRLTIFVTVLSVLFNVFFGIILALVLARQSFRGKFLLDEIVNLPLAISPVVAGFMFIILFGKTGWIGRWFEAGGIQIIYAVPGMILATMFVTLPFVAKEIVPVLREVGLEQEEAARTLGAGPVQIFRRVTLPSMRWGLAYGVTLTVARAMGEFGAVLVVSGSIIGKTQTATLHIHQEFTDFHYLGAFSASLVLAAVSFLMLICLELIKKRVTRRSS
jgi:sulfate/thiosulfate transport system permease protein